MITSKYLYDDGVIRVWKAIDCDYKFILHLCKQYRDFEFFYVPDESLRDEIRKGNIIAFDFNVFEAGYIWVTFPKNGKSRINQLAVDEELWRNKVGSVVTGVFESLADKYGMWSIYLSCNTNTMGHSFWPKVGYKIVCEKLAGSRGGNNIIWGKLLPRSKDSLFKVKLTDIKSVESYVNQSSITVSVMKKKEKKKLQVNQFGLFEPQS